MGVSNNDGFSFLDVKNEIENNGGATTNSLIDAFNNATFSGFDADFVGSRDNLLNFRNYNHINVNTLIISTDATGAINSNAFHTVSNISGASSLTLRFTYSSNFIADLPPTVNHEGNSIDIGYSTTINISVDASTYDIHHPFTISWNNCDTGTYVAIKMEVLSSTLDVVPSQNHSTVNIYDHC